MKFTKENIWHGLRFSVGSSSYEVQNPQGDYCRLIEIGDSWVDDHYSLFDITRCLNDGTYILKNEINYEIY